MRSSEAETVRVGSLLGDDDVADGDVVTARALELPSPPRRALWRARSATVWSDLAVQRVGDLDGVGQQQVLLPAARSAW